jgi:pimeloyl-ACP methyl ester carboxylesterase
MKQLCIYEPIRIGGIDQWIEVRGRDAANPLLLYLHGGPGASMKAVRHTFQDAWEERLTVVHWDQRGVGRTFRGTGTKVRATMNMAQMLADAEDLIRHLLARFGKQKLILLGHSWGSALGITLAKRIPDLLSAYVGVGQVVNMVANEAATYAHVLARARAAGHRRAVRSLERIGPVTTDGPWRAVRRKIATQRYWLHAFGGCMRGSKSIWPLFKPMFDDPDQSWLDLVAHFRGLLFSTDALGEEFLGFDAARLGYDFAVPLYFLEGRHDINTPSELAFAYFEKLRAPRKEFIWFEQAAHDVPYAERERFLAEVLRLAVR